MKMNKSFIAFAALLPMLFSLYSCHPQVQKSQDSVSVSGKGTVFAQPDMALVTICVSHTKPTTTEAKKAVEQTMQQVLNLLKDENIEDKSIKTIALNYDTEYEYRNSGRVKLGQKVQQTILVTVNNMAENPERFASIMDKIAAIDRTEVQGIQFDIEKKAELFKQSRELAYQKALEKARQYAELANRKIGKVLTVSEGSSQNFMQSLTPALMTNTALGENTLLPSYDSFVPTGEQGVSSEINIVFSLE